MKDIQMAQGKVRIEGVCKAFDASTLVLSDISFGVVDGSLACLLGPSGCGKSTLLSMVAGFVRPSRGRVTVDGVEITAPSADRGIVFQDYALFPWRTAAENVEFGPKIRRLPSKECREIAMHYLAMVGLEAHADKLPRQLSGGMKQRVAIARALANRPSVLLMDEPFGALDAQTRESLQEEMLSIRQLERNTILFVTHSISESLYLADRIVVMATRPGAVKRIFDVDLPYPRDRQSPAFLDLEQQIKQLVREEVLKLGVH
jgi:ABC-type nitrate/sulfonate/bicarbonate transport system ATPase subunit